MKTIRLDQDQRRAATMFDRPLALIAPAGTGKTEALTAKYMAATEDCGIDPTRIMCVTFTRKAAREIRRRVLPLLEVPGLNESELWMGTFHSLATRIMRQHGDETGLGADFSVPDAEERRRMLAAALRRVSGQDPDGRDVGRLARLADAAKNAGADLTSPPEAWPAGAPRPIGRDAEALASYQRDLRASRMADYGDIMGVSLRLLEHPEIGARWRGSFDVILVDEYQDVDDAQERWLSLMTGDRTHVTVAGDDDQSIYGFRGAKAERLKGFAASRPGCGVVTLRRNYRSPQDVVDRTRALLAKNGGARGAAASALEDAKGRVRARCHRGSQDMIDIIMKIVGLRRAEFGLGGICVMSRTHEGVHLIASGLVLNDVPAEVITSDRQDSPAMTILLSWLRLIVNPFDASALLNIVERHTTPAMAENLRLKARLTGLPILAAAERAMASGELGNERIAAVCRAVNGLTRESSTAAPADLIERVYDECNVEAMALQLPNGERHKFYSVYNSLMEISRTRATLREVLAEAQDDMTMPQDRSDSVLVSTMHAMKGLEAPIIISAGWDKGVFPKKGARPEEIEEERRLAGVTVARARSEAWLLFDDRAGASPFIEDMGLA